MDFSKFKDPKVLALGGGVIVGGIWYYRKQQAAAAAAGTTTDSTSSTDGSPTGSADTSGGTDGFGYGSATGGYPATTGDGTAPVGSIPGAGGAPGAATQGPPVTIAPRTIKVSKGETQKEIIQAAGETYSQFISDNPSLAKKGSKVHTGQSVKVR